jgi:hypothetical protein
MYQLSFRCGNLRVTEYAVNKGSTVYQAINELIRLNGDKLEILEIRKNGKPI